MCNDCVATGSSFASESFVSAQEMQTCSSLESASSPPQERVAFSAPNLDADERAVMADDSLGA